MTPLERLLDRLLGPGALERPLVRQALTHPSAAGDGPEPVEHNERLEFLGDAVLGLVVAEHFYRRFPDRPEGELSRLRAAVVCRPSLSRAARRLELGTVIRVGQSQEGGGRRRPSVLAAAMEAVIGAVYLEAGLETARSLVHEAMAEEIEEAAAGRLFQDHKTSLQEASRRLLGVDPVYRLVGEEGPDHDKRFHVEVWLEGRPSGRGSGRSKKEAEQAAAAEALRLLQES
ncbi:MAG: ribonuclease III [Thermaerobacter sp.]|nr:ribonuclease III [Bacillota bacterium]REJ37876.1 MAG: ribonuclease III [Bacillota bacterium]